jgi:Asp-tRNA(Asn)/Glu-tRNA(Gln) amidotransferase A subunit family amidase
LPVLGVPDGPFLEQASPEGLAAFEEQLQVLEQAGYTVQHVEAMNNIAEINHRHMRMVFAEMAQVHAAWFAQYEPLYRSRTVAAIREGQEVSSEELADARAGRIFLRIDLAALMALHGIVLWVCPSAMGAAPEGLEATGSPIMNLPWTHAGLPAISLPAGRAANGLPLGLQCTGGYMADEQLVAWVEPIASVLERRFLRRNL